MNVICECDLKCDLCDADYVGYTCRHLHQRIDEHKSSVVGEHMVEQHGEDAKNIEKSFKVLRKCRGKYECLLYEMLFIKELKPTGGGPKKVAPYEDRVFRL